MIRKLLLLVAAGILLWPITAQAQIYAWRDINGTLVLSDRKLVDGAQTYAVADTPALRVTRPEDTGERGHEFDSIVQEHAVRHAIRPELVRAVIQVESGFNPRALSPKGAMGLMQLMPATARSLGVVNPFDPADNIRGGTAYLRHLLDRFDGDESLALAAYNAGPEAVDRHGRQVPPYRETRDYVKKVGALNGGTSPLPAAKRIVYKTFEIVDGRAVPRYSTQPPSTGTYEIVH